MSQSVEVDGSIWHSIRPWIPPLSLTVREITSVSVTFILSATYPATDPTLASLGLSLDDEDEDPTEDYDGGLESAERKAKANSVVSRALARGLSVDVDGSPWRRVIIRIDDKVDEAVIIVYGLMPGRQYDIDLELVQGGQKNSIRKHVVTEGELQSLPAGRIGDRSTFSRTRLPKS
jgi:hypothetical protein